MLQPIEHDPVVHAQQDSRAVIRVEIVRNDFLPDQRKLLREIWAGEIALEVQHVSTSWRTVNSDS
jgi:hypothetical protein